MAAFTYSYRLGTYRRRTYHVGVRADPSLNDVQSFAVLLYYDPNEADRIPVAKVDNTEHREGDVHVDRYYRESSAPRKDFDVDISTLPEAEAYVCANWHRFADRYDANHR